MKVIKRDGSTVDFDRSKIVVAIQKANNAVDESERIAEDRIENIAHYVESRNRMRLLVEDIQDMVEHQLMQEGKFDLAKAYIIYRYTRYHLGATVEFLKQCDGIYGMRLMETDEMKEVIQQLSDELPKEDTSSFSFDRRTKDNKDNVQDGTGISLDDLLEYYDELRRQDLGDKTEEGQELRAMIRSYIEQEALSVRVTRSTSNRELLELIESEMEGPKPTDTPEDAPREEEHRLAETEERAERPRRRR